MNGLKIIHDLNKDNIDIIKDYFNKKSIEVNIKSIGNKIFENLTYSLYIISNDENTLDVTINYTGSKIATSSFCIKNFFSLSEIQFMIHPTAYFKFNFKYDLYVDRVFDLKNVFKDYNRDVLYFCNILLFNRFDDDYELIETLCAYIAIEENKRKDLFYSMPEDLKNKLAYYGYDENSIKDGLRKTSNRERYIVNHILNEVLKELYYNKKISIVNPLGMLTEYAEIKGKYI